MKRSFTIWDLPQYVSQWCGCRPRDLYLFKMRKGNWLLAGGQRALIVSGRTAPEAKRAISEFVCKVSPKTDRRRMRWFYT